MASSAEDSESEKKTEDSEEDKKEEKKTEDSEEDKKEDSEEEKKDGEEKTEDSEEEDKKDSSCNKDSAVSVKDSILSEIKDSLPELVTASLKEILGIKDLRAQFDSGAVDTGKKGTESRDYSSFLE
jgi:flagellar biosynthesis/type III secretory pathway protein FliH